MSSEFGVLKFFTSKPLNIFNNLNVRSIFLCLNKNAEIRKNGYSDGELCNVASMRVCLLFIFKVLLF